MDSLSNDFEETVGFKLAPQLNALGRLDDPNPAIELLTGFDDEEAQAIALEINAKNEERKEVVQNLDEAMTMVDLDKPVQVLAKEGLHPGVLGIVAGRIMEQISRFIFNIQTTTARLICSMMQLLLQYLERQDANLPWPKP